jgi:hypothetical protein
MEQRERMRYFDVEGGLKFGGYREGTVVVEMEREMEMGRGRGSERNEDEELNKPVQVQVESLRIRFGRRWCRRRRTRKRYTTIKMKRRTHIRSASEVQIMAIERETEGSSVMRRSR